MGRPKKPAELIKFEGKTHIGKEELERRKAEELPVIDDEITPPKYLTPTLKKRFNWYVEQLKELNIIGNVDAELLARYVVSEDQYQTISVKIQTVNPLGDIDLYSKLVNAQSKLFNQCRTAGSDLGLSITSRGKLVIPQVKEPPKELTPEQKLFGGSL